jgi:ketosteroid isomerase-like protein
MKRDKVKDALESWINAWREEDINKYISHYHASFKDPNKGDVSQFKNYKRAVFAGPGKPEIEITDLSIIQSGDYIRATFKQKYSSNTITDMGRKTLYLKQDGYYNWKIVAEKWSKNGVTSETTLEQPQQPKMASFVPSLRFFETTNPKAILGDRLLSKQTSSVQEESNN